MAEKKERLDSNIVMLKIITDLSNRLSIKPYYSSILPIARFYLSKNNCYVLLRVAHDVTDINGFVDKALLMLPLQKIPDFYKKIRTLEPSFSIDGEPPFHLEIRGFDGNVAKVFFRLHYGEFYSGAKPSEIVDYILNATRRSFGLLEKIETTIDEFRKFDVSFETLKRILDNAKHEMDKNRKGSLFEKFIHTLVSLDENIQIQGTNVNTKSEEIDVVLENLGRSPFYAQLQSPIILVECKNWISKVGADEIQKFAQKIQNRPRFLCKVGLMITTSEFTSDAFNELIGYRGKDFVIAVADGKDLEDLIEKKIYFSDFFMDKLRAAGLR